LPVVAGRLILVCVALVAVPTSLINLANLHREFTTLRDSYLEGHYSVLVGPIENFHNEIPHRTGPGELTVSGHTFIWDPHGEKQRFSASTNMSPPGTHYTPPPVIDVLHDGMRVQLRYMGDRIVRLEALTRDLPPDYAASTQPCP
jgi:hypothetical protein